MKRIGPELYISSLNTYLPMQRCPAGGSRLAYIVHLDNDAHPIRRGRNDEGGHLPDDRGHHPNWRVTAAILQPQPVHSNNHTQHGQNGHTATTKPQSHLGFRSRICKMKVVLLHRFSCSHTTQVFWCYFVWNTLYRTV